MRELMQDFIAEEMRHKKKLIAIKERSPTPIINANKTLDLKIADYIVDVDPAEDMSYEDALVVAMKLEKRAFQLYTDMAVMAADESIKQSLLTLANEEAKHKLHFEIQYDDLIKEN
jgi:rubrerythrin